MGLEKKKKPATSESPPSSPPRRGLLFSINSYRPSPPLEAEAPLLFFVLVVLHIKPHCLLSTTLLSLSLQGNQSTLQETFTSSPCLSSLSRSLPNTGTSLLCFAAIAPALHIILLHSYICLPLHQAHICFSHSYVFGAATAIFFVNTYHSLLTGSYRRAAKIPYPNCYASQELAEKDSAAFQFNCGMFLVFSFLSSQFCPSQWQMRLSNLCVCVFPCQLS